MSIALPSLSDVAPERDTLLGFLDYYRAVIARKVSGLPPHQLTFRLEPSSLTLGGIIQHLTEVERWWFRDAFAGEVGLHYLWSEDDLDGEFRVAEGATAEGLVAAYLAEVERAREVVAGASLNDLSRRLGTRKRTLRWIVVHMIEETARHAGHADLIREAIDGSVGD